MAHTLQLAGGCFSDLSGKHHKCIAKGVHNQQLGKWLQAAPESTTQLFLDNLDSTLQASQARRMDSLFALASCSTHPGLKSPASFSFQGHCFEPCHSAHQLFYWGCLQASASCGRQFMASSWQTHGFLHQLRVLGQCGCLVSGRPSQRIVRIGLLPCQSCILCRV